IGWLITFVSTCILRYHSLLWVNVFYNLFLLLGVTLAIATDAVRNYRLVIFWVFYFGAEEDSLLKRNINGFTIPLTPGTDITANGGVQGPTSVEQQLQQQQQLQQGENLSSVVVTPAVDYAYKACALYSYDANPEDSNELSFIKNEVLDIVDNKGKWWQARKQDGSIGIAPSNYLQLI
ncbi:Transmembrane osmosensor, partial [Podila epigama]